MYKIKAYTTYKYLIIFTLASILSTNINVSAQSLQQIISQKSTLSTDIKTVQLYPAFGKYDDKTKPAIVPLHSSTPLILEFDIFGEEYENLYARILHCNADWQVSALNELDYLTEYNEFSLTDFEFSFDTQKEYTHYKFKLPALKTSGNYLLLVYENGQKDSPVIVKKFILYENQTSISSIHALPVSPQARLSKQQIEFEIDYSSIKINNPHTDIKVVLRQNYRDDNAITGLKPTFIQQDIKKLEYKHFNSENSFPAGNEFRFFDLRSTDFPGQNVGRMIYDNSLPEAQLLVDQDRSHKPYTYYHDLNGQYVVNTADGQVSEIEAEYVNINFYLDTDQSDKEIYILGAFNDWQYQENNRLQYDEEKGYYTATILLKQGWYNYIYWVKDSPNVYEFEGSYAQTENVYDIIVYLRPLGGRADRVIGYKSQTVNQRR